VAAPPPDGDDEARLRAARYAALGEIAAASGAGCVATAHTAEDQTETVLLALFRGTGLTGLAGMAPTNELNGLRVLRPLLRATHAELMAEIRRGGLPYAIDPTNRERRYRRNAVRAALAELRTGFPQLDRSVARCAQIVRDELAGGSRMGARRRLRARLAAGGVLRDIPFERIEALLDARPGRRVFLKPGLELEAGEFHDGH
jgi:tRNA(Ile)-lysidine synthase